MDKEILIRLKSVGDTIIVKKDSGFSYEVMILDRKPSYFDCITTIRSMYELYIHRIYFEDLFVHENQLIVTHINVYFHYLDKTKIGN